MNDQKYIHGFTESEQDRLSRMQRILNRLELDAIDFDGIQRILDFGSGLGQQTRAMARQLPKGSTVIGIEYSRNQLEQAIRLADSDGESELVEFRQGSVFDPPLSSEEKGSFDLVHARFLLEHVDDPQTATCRMVNCLKPGGRIVLMDDDHELLRLWPACPELMHAWNIYWNSYARLGHDPLVGRKMVELLINAKASVIKTDTVHYGAAAGNELFDLIVNNLIDVIASAKPLLLEEKLLTAAEWDSAVSAADAWRLQPSACLWYSLPIVTGVRL